MSDAADSSSPAPLLAVQGLRKQFGDLVVLKRVDLTVPRGSVVTILGKSGTGKSVLLKCLAGIMKPDEGEVRFEGGLLERKDAVAMGAFRRRCSYLFQNNALLDSLTGWENVALPLEQATTLPKTEIRARVDEALERLELTAAAHSHPGRMSGGMLKRLALARALVTRPELVLFDEPTAGLDPLRRNAVFEMIVRYQREFGFTAVLVTHDLPEALAASDRLSLLDHGDTCFEGTAEEFRVSEKPEVVAFRESTTHLENRIATLRRGEALESEDPS